MNPSSRLERDPLLHEVSDLIAVNDLTRGFPATKVVLIAGPSGFGKTSVLRAAAELAAAKLEANVLWVPGGIVASEDHLSRLAASAAGGVGAVESARGLRALFEYLSSPNHRFILSIDDLDLLAFKRQSIVEILRTAIDRATNLRLLASCRPESAARLTKQMDDRGSSRRAHSVQVRILTPLGEMEALSLIRKRVPTLSPKQEKAILSEAGGHPAALVFLGRLAELRPDARVSELLAFAADFAGAIYAEGWAALGPQQRAIVWELSLAGEVMTAADISQRLLVPPPQVSSQLTRLVNEGFVLRANVRGRFGIVPLLARWVTKRANRGESL